MKKFITPLIVLVILITGTAFLATVKTEDPHLLDVNISQINKNITNGSTLVDVRTLEEYNENHASGATNLPLDDIKNGKSPEVSKNQVIYVYCRSGRRASEAKQILEQKGFTRVINLTSLSNWLVLGGTATNPQDGCDVKDQSKC